MVLKSHRRVRNFLLSQRSLERATIEGDSPVDKKREALVALLSTTGHGKSCGNLG